MPLDPAKVGLAVQSGLSIVCATCTRYWEGRDQGLPEPQCTTVRRCGSPLASDTFSEYVGPISNFEEWCFRCGTKSSHLVSVRGHTRKVGVCREHMPMFNEYRNKATAPSSVLLHHEGAIIRPEDLLKKKAQPKTLSEIIREAEKGDG